ncbi:MAG: Gamma-glutamyltransferase [Solirubrobacterales bacterium]|nr:Gamma-glutamyltransferase [Solirubrobacterales bacterium]
MTALTARGERGTISAPHPEAARIGAAVLADGGSAVDAAIAANAALGVAMPHMCGVGGDLFALVDPGDGGAPVAFNASGPASSAVDADRLHARGGVPARAVEAVTVPGAVDGWRVMHEAFGRLPWARLLTPAAQLADGGVAMTERARAWFMEEREVLARDPASRGAFLRDGEPPAIGVAVRLPDLARTLEQLAQLGPRTLYDGELAALVAATTSRARDGLLARDLASYRARTVPVASANIGGHRLVTVPPNSQGATTLILLRALLAMETSRPGSPAWTVAFLRAKRVAFAARDAELARAQRLDLPLGASEIDELVAFGEREPAVGGTSLDGDTVALATCDAAGTTCVVIQSLYFAFGSGITVPDTGIVLQNRGAYFSTAPGHPNRIGPGRRTLHTLMPMLAYGARGPLEAAVGTMGGDGQPQVVAQVLARLLWGGEDAAAAVAAPRLLHGRYMLGEPDDVVHVEDTLDPETVEALRTAGHAIESDAWPSQRMGHACAITAPDPQGPTRVAASDPRSDGVAVAL